MKRDAVLVTGGSGYIGSHLIGPISSAGFRPVIYDIAAPPVSGVEHVPGDIRNERALEDVFGKYSVRAVIHLAAITRVRLQQEAESIVNTNMTGGLTLLRVMKRAGCRYIVFTSSAAVYGHKTAIVSEDEATKPVSEYGKTKLGFERILRVFDRNLVSATLRLFNVAGNVADVHLSSGSKHRGTLVENIILTLIGHKDKLNIYGTNLPTPDGTSVRDYVHVSDVSDSIVRSLLYILNTDKTILANIASSSGISNLQVVQAAEKIYGRRILVRKSPGNPQEIIYSVGNNAAARSVLSWKPALSDIQLILHSAGNYYGCT